MQSARRALFRADKKEDGTLGCDNTIRDLNILKLNQQRLLDGFSNKIVLIRGRFAARRAFYTSAPVGEAREMPKRRSTGDHSYLQTASPSPLLLRATTRKTRHVLYTSRWATAELLRYPRYQDRQESGAEECH